ncbi:MAG: hypothetical protein VX951_08835 [Planctomycetota bacterium]|nr:hypothetical protein [Planctomycetota bacterium]
MGVPLVAGMAVAGAASSIMQAQQQNRAAKGLAENAISTSKLRNESLMEREKTMSGRIKKKADQDRLAAARATTLEAGSRVVAAAGQGTTAASGSAARGIADALFRGQSTQETLADNYDTDIESLRQQTESGQIENQASMMASLNQAQSMMQSPLLAGVLGGASGAIAGTGVNTGLGIG